MEIDDWLAQQNFKTILKVVKEYGVYFTAEKYYSKTIKYSNERKIEVVISDVKNNDKIHIAIRGGHYEGHCNGYVTNIEDIENVINFMSSERN
jgi:hypothetical protein